MFKGTFSMKIWVEQKNRPDKVVNVEKADVIKPGYKPEDSILAGGDSESEDEDDDSKDTSKSDDDTSNSKDDDKDTDEEEIKDYSKFESKAFVLTIQMDMDEFI